MMIKILTNGLTDKTYTIANEWLDVPDDIAATPNLQGYGIVYPISKKLTGKKPLFIFPISTVC